MGGDIGLSPARERRAGPVRPARLHVPSFVGTGIDDNSPEARAAQRFGQALIAAIEAWQHRERRRSEGWRP